MLLCLGAIGLVWHLLTLPKEFHRERWASEVNSERKELARKINEALLRSVKQVESQNPKPLESSKIDLQLANDIRHTKNRLLVLISEAERQLWFAQSNPPTANPPTANQPNAEEAKNSSANLPDAKLLADVRALTKLLAVSERVHRLRATLQEADRRSHAALQAIAHAGDDELTVFWNQDLPWLESELRQVSNPKTLVFARALNIDIERLTQTALDIELHRIDVWMDWAATQPAERLAKIKIQASLQVGRLEALSSISKASQSQPDPRLQSLQKGLRRMASVSNLDNW